MQIETDTEGGEREREREKSFAAANTVAMATI